MNSGDWRRRSIRSVWHPYTEITSFEQMDFPVIDHAEGSTLYDVDGRALLDGISSWWCVNLGHGHPRLVKAIRDQAGRLQHTLLGGMSHPAAIQLAEQLARIAPAGLGHAMFGGDGSLAVEAALKIALQYRDNRGEADRTLFIALDDGYHGDTLGAIGVGYIESFHRPFRAAVQPALRAMSPHCACCPFGLRPASCGVKCFDSMNDLIAAHHARCTAVIVEPLCQAAAGMRVYPAAYLQRLREACDRYGLLLIADEIAVGFGRTGAMFACGLAGIRPDIMAVGKGLTGGLLPMSATLVTDAVYDTFRADARGAHTLHHGTTFCGNPITSACALAALAVYEEEHIIAQLATPARSLQQGMARVAALLDDSPVSSVGMIAAVEIKASCGGAGRARKMVSHARNAGLLIRPLGATIYLWPPLNVAASDLARMLDILHESTHATSG